MSEKLKLSTAIVWLRRDLRLNDQAAVYQALRSHKTVLPIFIFDTCILKNIEDKYDPRVEFIHSTLSEIQEQLIELGSSLLVLYSSPLDAFNKILKNYIIEAVYVNGDYEPYALERDKQVMTFLSAKGIPFLSFKDQVIFEKDEVKKDDGTPYTVFTPYMRKWKRLLAPQNTKPFPTEKYFSNWIKVNAFSMPSLNSMGFEKSGLNFPSKFPNKNIIMRYKEQRDFPALDATSRLSVHLRFGTVSIRYLMNKAQKWNETWLNELIWREFYMMILFHFPHVVNSAFKKRYDFIPWMNNEKHFESWCLGKTGYPIVDAGMRELNETGFMHNRVRMIVASFLTKNLLIDWRWGEAYFAKKLMDYDLSANNGGWQWAASSGCDAVPYFRIFNPLEQARKFDPQLKYINKWIPELNTPDYPEPIVDHKKTREHAIAVYKKALG